MGIEPNVFGPSLWASIHYICLGAPETLDVRQKLSYKMFFEQLPYVIPCYNCGLHLESNLKKTPIDQFLTGSEDLFKWSVDLHNVVNTQLGKPLMNYEDARKHWKELPKVKVNNVNVSVDKNECYKKDKIIFFLIGFFIAVIMTLGIMKLF